MSDLINPFTELRKSKGYPVANWALILGVSPSYVNQLEKGMVSNPFAIMTKLYDLGVDIKKLQKEYEIYRQALGVEERAWLTKVRKEANF